jgi:hypothetical protein
MQRQHQPELLDSLPPHHPDALHSRRDLRLTNRILGNPRWFAQTLPPLLDPAETVLELGAGAGELARRLGRRGIAVDGLDLWPRPADWPAARSWHRADLRTFGAFDRYRAVIGNLIFHQFDDAELAALGRALRSAARVIVACEPGRRRISQMFFRAIGPLFGANRVTLHDGHVSIAAGFCGGELPRLLGLEPGEWNVRCTVTGLGAYRMVALRRS